MEKKLGKQIDIFFGGPHKFERQPSCRKAGDFPQRSTCWNCQASKTKRQARAGYVGPKPPLRKGVNFRFVTLPWLEIDKHINPQESKITWNRKTKSVYGFHRTTSLLPYFYESRKSNSLLKVSNQNLHKFPHLLIYTCHPKNLQKPFFLSKSLTLACSK